MLHRSFKPAKCKTALKLVASRIKLLKNKRESQIKTMKRDLANLLETGQDRTAMIRVEHVAREEKMMAAYDLLEIYCELIVARLPMIESQKHCPIDLKEPVTSVVFAAPRCADIPELLDIQKHFTAKYGKEFVNAAVELRPDCGVGRMLIEKLSVRAPDGPSKIKILKAIAEEQNISWNPESIEEKAATPPQDLLVSEDGYMQNGPSTFAKGSGMSYETPTSLSSQNYAPKDDEYVHLRQKDETSSPGLTPGTGPERAEFRPPYYGNENPYPAGRENWPLEFKDATSAAQAAAESAERASMAARAAAELATGETFKRESPSHEPPPVRILRNASSGKYSGSKMHDDHSNAEKGNHSASNRSSELPDDRLYTDSEIDKIHSDFRTHIEKVNESKPKTSAIADENSQSQVNTEKSDVHYQKTSSGISLTGIKKQSNDSDDEFTGRMHEGAETDDIEYVGEEKFEEKPGLVSMQSGSKNFDYFHDDVRPLNHNIFGDHADQEPMAGSHQENIHTESNPFSSYSSNVVFDVSDSEEEHKLDIEGDYKGEASNIFSSPSQGPTNFLVKDESRNTGPTFRDPLARASSQSLFGSDEHDYQPISGASSRIMVPSEPNEFPLVTFDDSDGGPSSESEEELDKSKIPLFSRPQNSPGHLESQNNSGNNDKIASNSAFSEQTPHQSRPDSKQTLIYDIKDSFPTESHYAVKSEEVLDQSNLESGKELNFGTLSGGLRNKGSRRPPYTKNPSSVVTSSQSKQAAETHSVKDERTYSSPTTQKSTGSGSYNRKLGSYNRKLGTKMDKTGSGSFATEYDSDSSDLEEEQPLRIFRNSQQTRSQKIATPVAVIDRLNPKPHGSFFDEEDNATDTSARKSPLSAAHSRRTKVTQYGSQANQLRDTSSLEEDHSTSLSEPKVSSYDEARRTSGSRKTYRTPSQTVSSSTETVNSPRSLAQPPIRESSSQQASHVHPKLPDIDDLTAHLNSLRKNRG